MYIEASNSKLWDNFWNYFRIKYLRCKGSFKWTLKNTRLKTTDDIIDFSAKIETKVIELLMIAKYRFCI